MRFCIKELSLMWWPKYSRYLSNSLSWTHSFSLSVNSNTSRYNTFLFDCRFIKKTSLCGANSFCVVRLKVSISPTFYKQIFCTKVFVQLLCAYNLGVYFFWQNEIGAKAPCKMLVKLTVGGVVMFFYLSIVKMWQRYLKHCHSIEECQSKCKAL